MILESEQESFDKYQRKSGDSIYFYDIIYEQEYLLYDFSSTIPRKISSFPGWCSPRGGCDTSNVFLSLIDSIDSDTLFGLKRVHWFFSIDFVPGAIDDEESRRLVDSLGLYAKGGFIYSEVLTGAIINGVQFGVITDVSEKTSKIPQFYTLSKNYPNPFNPNTTILYELPQQSLVTIKVFNILGAEITTLVNERQEAGAKSAHFDASGLPSGVYYYRITAVNDARTFTQTKKMLLLR